MEPGQHGNEPAPNYAAQAREARLAAQRAQKAHRELERQHKQMERVHKAELAAIEKGLPVLATKQIPRATL